ncbi:glucose-1-phosphate thymidylyltransferase [candidate division WOR_3 bacterium SM23_60]|uniref:Glucose-1-phosphate thymidylyltransferase n=1 Tax=candidate division WOR_3 bacterium SM23_60 TaxID=1703780 RepID=A0A0S8GI34_UNCW3|nr:MAG: glucose-1-phosphate thymidylyltransferase [candidate division WOR_3 bacterium SM23_60]
MKGLILSGGFGRRLRPLTYSGAKQLLPVANEPIIFYGINALVSAGIQELGIVVGDTAKEVKQVVGTGDRWGISIVYIQQEAPLGLAHAIKISRSFIENEPFVMYLGDNILKEGIDDFVKQFKKTQPHALILLTEVPNPQDFGVAVINGNGVVQKLIEKPKQPPSHLALVGVYLFNKEIYQAIDHIKPSWRNELEITDAIQWLLDNNYKVESHMVKGWWKDTGKPDDIIEANLLVLEGIRSSNKATCIDSSINGRIKAGNGTTIKKSIVRGPAVIGKNSEILNSYIGPFSSIGDNVIIENAEIECSVIMEGSTIRNVEKRIDRSIVGKNVVINVTAQSPRTYKFLLGDQSHLEIAK